jgi:uncharacterized protein (DUF427 family)
MLDEVEPPARIEPGIGQESVWDYPRPPRIEPCPDHVLVRVGPVTVAESRRTHRVLETSQAPAYYLPPTDVRVEHLVPSAATSFCEWKGDARYYDVVIERDGEAPLVYESCAWTYPDPTPEFVVIAGHFAFYPQVLECYLDGERVRPMPGGFYGGWITDRIVGPFKGTPGTELW